MSCRVKIGSGAQAPLFSDTSWISLADLQPGHYTSCQEGRCGRAGTLVIAGRAGRGARLELSASGGDKRRGARPAARAVCQPADDPARQGWSAWGWERQLCCYCHVLRSKCTGFYMPVCLIRRTPLTDNK